MKILIDTNVILDHLLERKPFHEAAEWIFSQTERGQLETVIGATNVTTIHYLLTKTLGTKIAQENIEKILRLFDVAPVNRIILASALLLNFTNFEDAVLHEAAMHIGAEAIITRDIKGFHPAKISVYSPHEFVIAFSSTSITLEA